MPSLRRCGGDCFARRFFIAAVGDTLIVKFLTRTNHARAERTTRNCFTPPPLLSRRVVESNLRNAGLNWGSRGGRVARLSGQGRLSSDGPRQCGKLFAAPPKLGTITRPRRAPCSKLRPPGGHRGDVPLGPKTRGPATSADIERPGLPRRRSGPRLGTAGSSACFRYVIHASPQRLLACQSPALFDVSTDSVDISVEKVRHEGMKAPLHGRSLPMRKFYAAVSSTPFQQVMRRWKGNRDYVVFLIITLSPMHKDWSQQLVETHRILLPAWVCKGCQLAWRGTGWGKAGGAERPRVEWCQFREDTVPSPPAALHS
jgi:hypothetical protein